MRLTAFRRASILRRSLILFALACAGLLLAACGGRAPAPSRDAFAAIVSGFSGGMLSAEGPVRVTFVNPIGEGSAGREVTKSPFTFTPSIRGKTYWADAYTLEFRPAAPMTRGRSYQATVSLERLLKVSPALREFSFGFSVIRQSYERELGGLEVPDENAPRWLALGGVLRLADREDGASVEKMLEAAIDGKRIPVKWEHRSDGREHAFRLDSLRRGESASRLTLSWRGAPVGVDRDEADTVRISSVNDFESIEASPVQGDASYLSLRFSDPLDRAQDFRGLVQVAGQQKLRFEARGNELRVYSEDPWSGGRLVTVDAAVRSALGKPLRKSGRYTVIFDEVKPGVRFVGRGVILPGEGKLMLPFEAVNLSAVKVSVIRVYAGNVPQFLQVNDLNGGEELQRVGRPVFTKTMALKPSASARTRWARYALDLSELAAKTPQPGTLYRVTLSFDRRQSTYSCPDTAGLGAASAVADEPDWDEDKAQASGWDGIEEGQDDNGYNWEEREDPCRPTFYMKGQGREAARNFLASNIGLTVKRDGAGRLAVTASDLLTAGPLADAALEVINFQQQVMARGKTDAQGFADLDVSGKPFLLRATKGAQTGYLKLDDGSAVQMGQFDVGGLSPQKGVKGFLFGERGVWRPGDTLFLTFVLEDREHRIPDGQPLTFELRDPRGRLVRTLTRPVAGTFNAFVTTTDPDGPTGTYRARVKAGPAVFEEPVKIETVVPNRLKIRTDVSPKPLTRAVPLRGAIEASWLSGSIARNLDVDVEMTLTAVKPGFPIFTDYEFSDPSREFSPETQSLFTGKLDAYGKASFSRAVDVSGTAPGVLNASFRTRVREAGGAASIDRFTEPFHPYAAYVGLRLPPGDKARGMLLTDTTHRVRLAVLTPAGQRVPRRRVEVQLYKLEWRWWWEKGERDAVSYSDMASNPLQSDTVTASNGEATWGLMVHYPDWGRYLLRVCDLDGGSPAHCAGRVFYMDWPGWAGRAGAEGAGGGAAILPFTSDKPRYNVGEPVRLTLPSPEGGRALISIEKGDRILKRYWVDLKEKETVHEFQATADMTPNVYVYAALFQPYARTHNDRPVRLYNVVPIRVENPATRLSPRVTTTPTVFRPGGKAVVTVSETQGRAMEYVVGVVDEGLLDLTRFKTPDPWDRFYAREALGVKTWDMFDFVAGAQGGGFERVLSIGGDQGVRVVDAARGNRFPPMVRFFGPFKLEKGREARHEFTVPQYVGSVRVMVVAGSDGAYGRAEKAVPVRNPLMVLGVLPRALAPSETFDLPVSVFATESSVRDATVEVTVSGPIQLAGGASGKVTFTEPSDKLLSFSLKTRDAVGWGKVVIRARSGDHTAEQTLDIEVRNPNAPVVDVLDTVVEPGGSWTLPFRFKGVSGTNRATLEFSRIPPLDLTRRLNYLVQYPHGCAEQTTSAAFPQLYLDALTTPTPAQKAEAERNVKAAIQRLRGFQLGSGGFSLWPGEGVEQSWVTNYVGHFLIEAEKKGYSVQGMLEPWRRYQRIAAQESPESARYGDQITQAYRLYTLALAGSPEQGAMNRLRESRGLSLTARWQLGAAYQLAGQTEVAADLVQGRAAPKSYSEQDGTFGSDLRDRAMMLDVLTLLGRKAEAAPLFREVSATLSRPGEWSTQSTAYALMAAARYAGSVADRSASAAYAFAFNSGAVESGKLETPLLRRSLKIDAWDNTLKFWNKSKEPLFARVFVEGSPALGEETPMARGLSLEVRFTDLTGKPIDPSTLEQGADFVAEYVVRHSGGLPCRQLALSAVFASGWEVRNTRLDPVGEEAVDGSFTYQDFRDDRVHTYFNLGAGKEKVFRFLLNASYLGSFRLPQATVTAMYDPGLAARTGGRAVKVVPAKSVAR